MKKVLMVVLWSSFFSFSFAQTLPAKRILYLIPFFSEKAEEINPVQLSSDDDIYSITSFQLVSFWEGSKLALDEFTADDFRLEILVRDITDDSVKLKRMMNDQNFMDSIDLIIGPFFSNMFSIAARYARMYEIPIVNPFSNRTDFLEGNEFVYKVMPSPSSAPQMVASLLEKDTSGTIFFWTENDQWEDSKEYIDYFLQHNIPFTKVPFQNGISNLTSRLQHDHPNIIIVSAHSQAKVIHNFRQLSSSGNLPEIVFIIPEVWLEKNQSEIEIFNQLKVHFFSNYFVDYKEDNTLYFMSEFLEKYHSPPDLTRFSFQGYDITKYFVSMLKNDFDATRFSFTPLSLDFDFKKRKDGGYENRKKRLLMLHDFEIVEIKL